MINLDTSRQTCSGIWFVQGSLSVLFYAQKEVEIEKWPGLLIAYYEPRENGSSLLGERL